MDVAKEFPTFWTLQVDMSSPNVMVGGLSKKKLEPSSHSFEVHLKKIFLFIIAWVLEFQALTVVDGVRVQGI